LVHFTQMRVDCSSQILQTNGMAVVIRAVMVIVGGGSFSTRPRRVAGRE